MFTRYYGGCGAFSIARVFRWFASASVLLAVDTRLWYGPVFTIFLRDGLLHPVLCEATNRLHSTSRLLSCNVNDDKFRGVHLNGRQEVFSGESGRGASATSRGDQIKARVRLRLSGLIRSLLYIGKYYTAGNVCSFIQRGNFLPTRRNTSVLILSARVILKDRLASGLIIRHSGATFRETTRLRVQLTILRGRCVNDMTPSVSGRGTRHVGGHTSFQNCHHMYLQRCRGFISRSTMKLFLMRGFSSAITLRVTPGLLLRNTGVLKQWACHRLGLLCQNVSTKLSLVRVSRPAERDPV